MMDHIDVPILFLSLGFLLLSCSSDQKASKTQGASIQPRPTGKTVVYDCLEEWNIPVKIDSSRAWLFLEDTTVYLQQIRAASGARYESGEGDYMLWSKGDEAIIEANNRSFGYCDLNREEVPWQDAKLRGAIFRATGFEPGWHLEIFSDSIRYVLDYGERSFATPTPDPETDREKGETVYQFESDITSGTIRIADEECTAPSGREFSSTVYLTVDGKEYRGCGRLLGGQTGS